MKENLLAGVEQPFQTAVLVHSGIHPDFPGVCGQF